MDGQVTAEIKSAQGFSLRLGPELTHKRVAFSPLETSKKRGRIAKDQIARCVQDLKTIRVGMKNKRQIFPFPPVLWSSHGSFL